MQASVFIPSLGTSRPVRCSRERRKETRASWLASLVVWIVLSIWGIKLGLLLSGSPSLSRIRAFLTFV